jgi:hypothetical protein
VRKFLRRAWLPVLCSVVFFLLGIAAGSAGSGTPSSAPSPASTASVTPPATRATTAAPHPKSTPSSVTLLHVSGSGNYNSAPFTVGGDDPQLVVTYTFSGNADESGPDNFIADVISSGDDQNIVNTIAASGGTTTRVYPEPDGDTSYHLSVQASGSWSFTITEAG